MPGASANRVDIRYIKEVTWGVTPATPALTPVRFTGESLTKSITTEKSQEIRADRSVADLIPVDASISGGIQFELSAESYNDWIESLMMSAWTDAAVTDEMTTLVQADDNLVADTAGAFTDVAVGMSIRIDGFANALNNRIYRVVGKTDNETISVFPQPAAAQTTAAVELTGRWIKNGVTEQSYSVIKRFNDASPVITQLFTGVRMSALSLELATASLVTGEWTVMGKGAGWGADPAVSGETNLPGTTTPVMNAVTNISELALDGTSLCASGALSGLTIEIDNQHREQKGLCNLGNVGVVAGQFMANFSGSQYFANSVEAQKFEDADSFEFSVGLIDALENVLIFHAPKCKYESFEANASGLDSDVMAETSFTALYDPDMDGMLMISYIPVTVSS